MNATVRAIIAFCAGIIIGMALTVIGYPARAVFKQTDCTKPTITFPDDRYFNPAERTYSPANHI